MLRKTKLAIGTVVGAGGLVIAMAGPALATSFSSGGQSLSVSISCSASETIVSKVSGSSVEYAARSYGGRPGHWVTGNYVKSGNSYAIVPQRTNSGVSIKWSSGTKNYTTGC